MAQLSPPAKGVTLAEALALVEQDCAPATGTEQAPLQAALSRILASDIVAPFPVPPTDNSAVDGYAFRHAGPGATPLRMVGRAAAGHPFTGALGAGEAVRIFTGAAIPAGADTVAMQEDARALGDRVSIPPGLAAGDNRRRAGEDIAQGARVFAAGRVLGPVEIGVLASLGLASVSVRAPLRVAVFSTGDELVDAGGERGPNAIYDSNRPALLALLAGLGAQTLDLGILPDRRDAIEAALRGAALRSDAIVSSAGMSVGDEDRVGSAVEALGALDFWNVTIRPGRPLAVGRVGDTPFFGLPGNPAAAVIAFLLIVRPALLRLAGARVAAPLRYPVAAGFAMHKRRGRREFLRCILREQPDGTLVAQRLPREGAGILSSIAECDGFFEIGEDIAEVAAGAILPFLPLAELGL